MEGRHLDSEKTPLLHEDRAKLLAEIDAWLTKLEHAPYLTPPSGFLRETVPFAMLGVSVLAIWLGIQYLCSSNDDLVQDRLEEIYFKIAEIISQFNEMCRQDYSLQCEIDFTDNEVCESFRETFCILSEVAREQRHGLSSSNYWGKYFSLALAVGGACFGQVLNTTMHPSNQLTFNDSLHMDEKDRIINLGKKLGIHLNEKTSFEEANHYFAQIKIDDKLNEIQLKDLLSAKDVKNLLSFAEKNQLKFLYETTPVQAVIKALKAKKAKLSENKTESNFENLHNKFKPKEKVDNAITDLEKGPRVSNSLTP